MAKGIKIYNIFLIKNKEKVNLLLFTKYAKWQIMNQLFFSIIDEMVS